MFGFGKPTPPKRDRKRDPSQLGLFGISDDISGLGGGSDDDDDDVGDADLEAELAAITAGLGGGKPKPKAKGKSAVVAPHELDAMIAASLRDVASDEEVSGDDDDSELLDELSAITGGIDEDMAVPESKPEPKKSSGGDTASLIKSRIQMYTLAEENAKSAGDSGKARRFNRGLKTLKDQLKLAEAGKPVNPSDIPPEVSVKGMAAPKPAEEEKPSPTAMPSRPAPPPPVKSEPSPPPVPTRRLSKPPPEPAPLLKETVPVAVQSPQLRMLNERKLQYKAAALEAKKAGDSEKALAYVKILKQFDVVIQALENGEDVDLSRMPPPPSEAVQPEPSPNVPPRRQKQEENLQQEAEVPAPDVTAATEEMAEEVLIEATTVLEALQQRLAKFKTTEQAAKDEGNSSKARRIGRIVKQYEDAVKLCKAGKPIPVDELPTPPGYGPIPVDGPPKPQPEAPPPKPAPVSVPAVQEPVAGPSKPVPKVVTQYDKQLTLLNERMREYKQAAVEAKKAGDLDEAKECLRVFKGLEKLIDIAKGGGRIDMSTVPISPAKRKSLEDTFTIVSSDDCTEVGNDVDADTRVRLEEQLAKQLILCRNTRDHHRAIGDIAGMNKFENLALAVEKDLDIVRLGSRKGLPLPKFHYEKIQFNVVKCNTDLSDNEVEVSVLRGINYNVPNPNDVDTYVKFEFPYPQEDPFKGRTNLVKDTHSPDYNHRQRIEIQRSQRNCQRIFKRHAVKCEVYSKGGFLRSDTLIGTVLVKLQPLETQVELHDSFPLMDGRRAVGGKLEVKVRVRNPILTKQIEQINERWIVFDA